MDEANEFLERAKIQARLVRKLESELQETKEKLAELQNERDKEVWNLAEIMRNLEKAL